MTLGDVRTLDDARHVVREKLLALGHRPFCGVRTFGCFCCGLSGRLEVLGVGGFLHLVGDLGDGKPCPGGAR